MRKPQTSRSGALLFPIVHDYTMPFLKRLFLTRGKVITVKKKGVVFDCCDRLSSLYYLSKGLCFHSVITMSGNSRILSVMIPGASFGEFASVMAESTDARVEAAETSEIITLPAQLVKERIKLDHTLAAEFFKFVYGREVDMRTVISYFTEINAPQRFALFMRSYSEKFGVNPENGIYVCPIKLTAERLGEIIGVNRITTSAMLNFMEKQGLIKRYPHTIEFKAKLIENDFIAEELGKSKWGSLKTKKKKLPDRSLPNPHDVPKRSKYYH